MSEPLREPASRTRPLFPLLAVLVPVVLLWQTPVIYPLRVLVVFFHELSHGLAAVLTGGRIVEIQIYPGEGGLCITQGGWHFAILTAGYLGSLLWGGALIVLESRLRDDRWLLGSLAALILLISIVFVRPLLSFGLLFGVLMGGAMLGLALYAPQAVSRVALQVIGLTSILYAPLDILDDVLLRPHLPSDAVMLAEATWIPAVVWGVLWIVVAIAAAVGFLRLSMRRV
ncbi:MAG: M50 family metallopeptidase [Candidatus Hydrogenedentes bacterium]|nr:M50 family metallopeptidase [Candidatus Hydrogenedentota bacterium]